MVFGSLRTQILFAFIAILTVCQFVAFLTLYKLNDDAQQERTVYHLSTAKSVFLSEFEQRGEYLEAFVETAAQDYGLKQAVGEDRRSFLVALNNHRQRIDADIAIAISAEGRVFGKLIVEPVTQRVRVGEEADLPFRYTGLLAYENVSLYYRYDERIFQLSVVPVRSGAEIIAWLGFGFAVDSGLAQDLSAMTGMTVNFMLDEGDEWTLFAIGNKETYTMGEEQISLARSLIDKESDEYVRQTFPIGDVDGMRLEALMYEARSDFLGTLQSRWVQVMLLFASMVLLSFIAAFIVAKRIVKPLKMLVVQARQIARGESLAIVELDRSDELGQLAAEFNIMQKAVISREEEIKYRACHMDVTQLPNRQKLNMDIAESINERQSLVLMRFKLIEYEEINYSLGSAIGEELQLSVSKKIASAFVDMCLYQLSDDEFALLTTTNDDINRLTFEIEQSFRALCSLHLTTLSVHMVAGFSVYPDHAETADILTHNAGIALQKALKQRVPSLEFQPEMAAEALSRVQLTHDLTNAIESSQLVLFYQPKLSLSEKRVTRCEALVRWQHPTRGMIPPDEFIGIAESTGQINALTDWVVNEAISQLIAWRNQGVMVAVAINISAENLKQPDFHIRVAQAISDAGLPNTAMSLEMTESALMDDPEGAIAMLEQLASQGISLSIDDYGTGYSSLSQLKNMPVDELKIDRAFVSEVTENSADQTICTSTIELAHRLNLTVVAEGIETKEALDWLCDAKCEYAQGYYISRPLPAAEFVDWLRSSGYLQAPPQREQG